MTPDEIRAFKKFIADAFRMVENASCVVEEPSHEQVQELDDDVNELAKRIESLRYQLVGKYAK